MPKFFKFALYALLLIPTTSYFVLADGPFSTEKFLNSADKLDLKGKVKQITSFSPPRRSNSEAAAMVKKREWQFDEKGKLLKLTKFFEDDNPSETLTYSYDAAGQLHKYEHAGEKGKESHTDLNYDSAGRLTGIVGYGIKGEILGQTEYSYDKAGNCVLERLYSTKRWLQSWRGPGLSISTTYKYDGAGRVTEWVSKYANPQLSEMSGKISYNSDGQVSQRKVYEGANVVYEETLVYDGSGNLISAVRTGSHGYNTEYRYDYDAQGNWISSYSKSGTEPGAAFKKDSERKIIYY